MKILLLLSFCGLSFSCTYEDVTGSWTFYEDERTKDHTLECGYMGEKVHVQTLIFQFPNIVTDQYGNAGTWTLIGFTGFEANINERSYFAYFTSYCDTTYYGCSRDKTVRNWSCYYAAKNFQLSSPIIPRKTGPVPKDKKLGLVTNPLMERKFINNHDLIHKINTLQTSWKAKAYNEHEKYTLEEMLKRAGGRKGRDFRLPNRTHATNEDKARIDYLPNSFDWRNVGGVNYVSPVRDQGGCGSCYAFSSAGSLEARIRIVTRNQRQDIFSPQDMVECTFLSSGCDGGWPYLIGGRYAEEQGVVDEKCNPYTGVNNYVCNTDPTCSRTYVQEYQYVGGYYGGCNAEKMMEALVTGGPFPVLFMVYDDFYYYTSGVYKHTSLRDGFNPYEPTNHAVLLVGYGTDETTGENFWSIKNSWSDTWGEDGYFRILRGTDECSIESAGFIPTPIP